MRGPMIGATVDGYIDYMRDEVRMRGTFVPLYGLNNMFGQIPVFGLFLGGSNEGLLGVTYEVVGPPGAPVLRVNPISAVAPGLLRKFFEFPPRATAARRATADAAALTLDPTGSSHRLQQHVALRAERELDDAFGRQLVRRRAPSSRRSPRRR